MKLLQGKLNAIFVKCVHKEKARNGKPYTGVVLANGRAEKLFSTDLPPSEFESFNEDDIVVAEIVINPFSDNDYDTKVIGISAE